SPLSSTTTLPRPIPPSFPTRRSSDLHEITNDHGVMTIIRLLFRDFQGFALRRDCFYRSSVNLADIICNLYPDPRCQHTGHEDRRSEEHTSELQSRFDLVCRLLLVKTK